MNSKNYQMYKIMNLDIEFFAEIYDENNKNVRIEILDIIQDDKKST